MCCKVEEEEYSLWHLLPRDVLWMIIEGLDLLDFDSVSAVCGNWKSGCKSYCTISKKSFPLPKDTLPWLMTRKNRNSSVIKLYRPSTNRTYNIDMPEINGNMYMNLDKPYTITECGNELFVSLRKDNIYKIDHSILILRRVDDVSSMILFKNANNIGFMVREECTKAQSLLLNNLKNHGCQINPSTKETYRTAVFEKESYKLDGEMAYQYDRSTQNWVKFNFDNLVSFGEDTDVREWKKQMKAKEKLLVKKLIHGEKTTIEYPPFVVDRRKTGFWINIG
ncbi:hypothetical protein FRX31_033360 [Thalictrum thalictroides]|uniref:F-box domain-containing protein n=1 Tax=Thalictrum thalictroides TaxID=46969 RepID=A0A7J6UWR2_THATH|nr:hypothetical protein FRX31_033360 [Thalictrum thalictroides]